MAGRVTTRVSTRQSLQLITFSISKAQHEPPSFLEKLLLKSYPTFTTVSTTLFASNLLNTNGDSVATSNV